MIRVSVIDFLIIFIEDLKLHEVDSLLKQVHVAEVLHMKHKLGTSSVHPLDASLI